ncbi:hypothetical protein [Oceanobacillus sp. J11TS1]|uniref:hypothetical protein n=1 Tax=Oceanobacillus sp. J11TS1 TaxID=2807191 RepID=UPI001B0B9B60|nr:hypothetical protein [Oceanobacillus sp. J11TS1]GIO23392.1 hypothetical protein J11TS1_19730 [Oceanobacillus sp. J11TS1]
MDKVEAIRACESASDGFLLLTYLKANAPFLEEKEDHFFCVLNPWGGDGAITHPIKSAVLSCAALNFRRTSVVVVTNVSGGTSNRSLRVPETLSDWVLFTKLFENGL